MLLYLFSFPENIISCHLSDARCRFAQSAKHAHGRSLSGSISTQKAKYLSPVHLKGDMIYRCKITKTLCQLLHFNDRSGFMPHLLPFQRRRTKDGCKLLKNTLGSINSMNLSMIDKSNPVTLPGFIHDGSRNNNGNTLFPQVPEHLPKFLARHRIHSGSGFIQK